jgi:hypothetical protein
MIILSFDEKVEIYKKYLAYKHWTFSEAVALLSGFTEFSIYYNLHPEMRPMFGRDRFGLVPKDHTLKISENVNKHGDADKMIDLLCRAIKKDDITAFSIKMIGCECVYSDGVTYFFNPKEIIALVVTQGLKLPRELQVAAGVYQIDPQPFTEPTKKQVKRQAVVQAFWHKYPYFSISEVCRRLEKLKTFRGFEFINDSVNRNREVVKVSKPTISETYLPIPGVFEGRDGIFSFDFQRLNIIVNKIANLLMLGTNKITGKDLTNYPLINFYISIGGKEVESIVNFSLRATFEYLYVDSHRDEF